MAVYKIPAYLDYNRDTSTGTGSEQSIEHGLSAKPTKVKIYPTGDPSGTIIAWGATKADETYIYVTVTNGKAFAWEAFLEP